MEIDTQQLRTLVSELKVNFIDGESRLTVQIEGFAPIYFPNAAEGRSDNLPGGSCADNIRPAYANSDQPYEALMTAVFIWLRDKWPVLSMIDVGALWGQEGLTAASIFERSTVHLFEMNPFVSEVLQGNADLNRHLKAEFHVRNMLVSKIDKQDLVTFKYYTARYGASEGGINLSPLKIIRENLKSHLKKLLKRPTRGEYIKRLMRIVTIDTYCREQSIIPNLIKVDVEGSEYDVLLGAKNILQRHHPILLVEFHTPRDANYIQKSNREMVRMLEGLDYRCLWSHHRDRHAGLYGIDSRTDRDIEVNSLGIFY
jgi:FkbM family methyltransferase